MGKYYVSGYTTPSGVNSKTEVKRIQAVLGVKQDGVWGAQTQAAWDAQGQGNSSMPKPQAARNQQAQSRMDYAASGFKPPSGVTDRQMVRSIQSNLGVKEDGVWGPKTQAAWVKQYGGLWQEDAAIQPISSNGYTPPKGIDTSEEIRQVQHRLHVEADGIWGKDTQEAWDKMRAPDMPPQAPKGIDSAEEIRQVQRCLRVKTTGVWDSKTQEAWDKMRNPEINQAPKGIDNEEDIRQVQLRLHVEPTGAWDSKTKEAWNKMKNQDPWLISKTFTGIKEYYDNQISALHEEEQLLRDRESRTSGPMKESIKKEIILTHNKLDALLKQRDSGIAKNKLIGSLEEEKPFYSAKNVEGFIANIGRKLWYNDSDISVQAFYRLMQIALANAPNLLGTRQSFIKPKNIDSPNRDALKYHADESKAAYAAAAKEGKKLENDIPAFNKDGYIINQDKMGDVQYVAGNTAKNGCGWVAAYNASKMLGLNPDAAEILTAMEPGALIYGTQGTNPFYIADYFSSQGYEVEIHTAKDKVEKAAREADANILVYLYVFKDSKGKRVLGGHYVAFNYDPDKERFHFYNGNPRVNDKNASNAEGFPTIMTKDAYADLPDHYLPDDILRFSISIYKR